MKQNQDEEIEVRFLEVDKDALVAQLQARTDTEDMGGTLLTEAIFYDKALTWQREGKEFLRLRSYDNEKTVLTYKKIEHSLRGTTEIESTVGDFAAISRLLSVIGYPMYRTQEKKRHTFHMKLPSGGVVMLDIDTWPTIPTYLEIEGTSEEDVKKAAEMLGFSWEQAKFRGARAVIEEVYGVPVGHLKVFTFAEQK